MPDILTHTLFSKLVSQQIKNEEVRKIIYANLKLFQLAAQGPDFLFYYKPFSLFNPIERQFGHIMHNKHTAVFFTDAFKKLKKQNDEKLLVYMLGFLCHFHLDKNIHPYVYYIEENGIWDYNDNKHTISHYDLEVTMDTRLWKEYESEQAVKVDDSKLLNVENFPKSILSYISSYASKHHNIKLNNKKLLKAEKTMVKLLHILYDPNNKKKILYKLPLPRKPYIVDGFLEWDILNTKKNEWHYLGESEMLTYSVFELIDISVKECVSRIDEIIDYLFEDKKIDIEHIISNVSYNTNRKA